MSKVLIGSIIFVGIYNLLFYPTVPGIGICVLFLLFNLYLFLVRSNQAKNLLLAYALSGLSIFFAFSLGWRANGIVQFLDVLFAVGFSILAGYFYKKETVFSWSIFSFILAPFAAGIDALVSTYLFFTRNSFKSHSQSYGEVYKAVFRGLLISIPIIFVLYLLLSGADPIFASLLGKISFSLSWQVIISLFLFVLCFVWGITKVKNRLKVEELTTAENNLGGHLSIESLVVTVAAATLFAVFLFIQLEYLFLQVPETELQHLGINIKTYSEYVRQGFFQLLFASAIATGIVAYILQYVHNIGGVRKLYLQIGMFILTLETELLLLSAGKRLYLYAEAHGLTRSRIFGIIFLIWLSLVLFLLLVAIVKKLKPLYFFGTFFVITVLSFMSFNVFSMDKVIATKYPPTINKQIDYGYILNLSPEAAEVYPSFMQFAQKEWATLSAKSLPTDDEYRRISELRNGLWNLQGTVFYLDRKYTKDPKQYIHVYDKDMKKDSNKDFPHSQKQWQAYNSSEYAAYLIIQKQRAVFEQILPMLNSIQQRQNEWYEESALRNTPPAPVQ